MQIELLQFRHSPYNEKVRWVLDAKRVAHRRTSLLPGPHIGRIRSLTGGTTTPVLLVDGQPIGESAAIVERLEAMLPTPALLPAGAQLQREVLELQRRFDTDWVPRVRRAVLQTLLATPRYFAAVFADGRPDVARFAYSLALPLAAPLIRRGNGITGGASVDDGLRAAEEGLDLVARRTAVGGWMVGDAFSLADIVACASLAPIVHVPDSPMTKPQPMPQAFQALQQRFDAHPGTAWVREVYRRHRGATADFDGESDYAA